MDLSILNTFQQTILFLLLILGSAILISSTVLMVRKRAFEAELKGVSDERDASRRASALELQNEFDMDSREGESSNKTVQVQTCRSRSKSTVIVQELPPSRSSDDRIHWLDDDQVTVSDTQRHHHHHGVFSMTGVGARPDLNNHPRDVRPPSQYAEESNMFGFMGLVRGTQKYFSSKGLISRNSQFHGLSAAEREELGGVEYQAVSLLSWIVPLYFALFLFLGIIGVGSWLQANHPNVTRVNGLDPFWTGAFFAVSAFVNSGMSLLDKNMTALQLK